jgi:hypothetical protein
MAEDKKDAPAKAPAKTETKTADADTATTLVDTGKPSDDVDAGESKGTDTIDRSAKDFVQSGADAKASVKDRDAPSGDKTREPVADRELARDNIENMASGNSNHNTLAGVNPVAVEQADRPDYNPQRRPSSRANQQSSIGESPIDMAERVNAKKEAPTNAEITTERRNEANDRREEPLTGYQSPYLGEN